jgi:hypothetical protein
MMMIQLNRERSEIETEISGYISTWYGAPKTGKTTLASKVPQAYFLATEPGHRFVSVHKSEPRTWQELTKYVQLLCKEDHDFANVVFDTVSNAYDMCCEWVCKHNPWKPGVDHISELDWGKGFGMVKQEFRKIIRDLSSNGFGIIFIAHEMIRDLEFHGVKRSRILPNLNKSARDAVLDISDMIGRIYVEPKENGEEGIARYMTFKPHVDWEAGDRTGRFERVDRIELTSPENCWEDIVKVFQGDPS